MPTATGMSTSWADASLWPAVRRSPFVVVLAGLDNSEIVDAALTDTALTETVVARFESFCTPPCDALLWRLETETGESLNLPKLLRRHWHRPPYAMKIRLVQYQPGSAVAELLDEGVIGTRGSYTAFRASVDRSAMRFVRDSALDRGRGLAGLSNPGQPHGLPGWLDAVLGRWHQRFMTEWWSLGTTTATFEQVLGNGDVGVVTWYRPKAGHRYLADPFPWPDTGRILCEEMPLDGGVGRIVSVEESGGTLSAPTVVLDDGQHHSYPCTFRDADTVFCVPEAPLRGATRIYRLDPAGVLLPICDVAPHARLADSTLFRWNGLYWLACTDLDLGEHDNLCLLYASNLTGPWTPHARWPVKIDIRGARPAGMMFEMNERLFRPAQDCASTYGAAVSLHEVTTLTETEFSETPVTKLRPNKSGPFPDGLHTLVHDGERFWLDGKRFVFDLGMFRRKVLDRTSRFLSEARAN